VSADSSEDWVCYRQIALFIQWTGHISWRWGHFGWERTASTTTQQGAWHAEARRKLVFLRQEWFLVL